jgi:threonyl-tRNA synthetase
MNCPGHILIYKSRKHSYRELPIRFAELGTVYRRERSGVLHGTLRVRGFTQDDAHIFCTGDQLAEEIAGVLDLAFFMLSSFGFKKFEVDLSVRDPAHPEKYLGEAEQWSWAESVLARVLQEQGVAFKRVEGEAVFYGPKIDIHLYDALNRKWQGPTIQVDFNLADRFNVTYTAESGKDEQVFMVHRTVLGALERFLGNLIEHYAGEFPVWLAPEQVRILTVTDATAAYAESVQEQLRAEGLRAGIDVRGDRIGAKIRDAELLKIPYMLIVGKKEQAAGAVSVRSKKDGDLGSTTVDEFKAKILEEVKQKL